jgi:phage tail sheath gpL-like
MSSLTIPGVAANQLVPLFCAGVSNSQANSSPDNVRALILAPMLATGSATPAVPVIVGGYGDAVSKLGLGSVGADMVRSYRANDPFGEVWILPLADPSGGAKAAGSISFTGPATVNGSLNLYLGDELVQVGVTAGMTATQLAAAVVAQMALQPDLTVTGAVDGTNAYQVDFTFNHKGLLGNDMPILLNKQGSAGGEYTPAGIAATIVAMANGTGAPSLTTPLANLGPQAFEVFINPNSDAASMTSMAAFLNDTAGRWSPGVDLYGHHITGYRGTYSALTTWGVTNNDQHSSAIELWSEPTPIWREITDVGAQAIMSVRDDASQPIRGVPLATTSPPPMPSRFSLGQCNALLIDGLSTTNVIAGQVYLEKLVTTYQVNTSGAPDNSYRDAETLFNLAYCLRQLKGVVTSQLARSKLAADAPGYNPPNGVVTPSIIRNLLIAQYQTLCDGGYAQQPAVFAAGLVVQINAANPNRVDVLWPAVLIERLDIMAVLAQFRLR